MCFKSKRHKLISWDKIRRYSQNTPIVIWVPLQRNRKRKVPANIYFPYIRYHLSLLNTPWFWYRNLMGVTVPWVHDVLHRNFLEILWCVSNSKKICPNLKYVGKPMLSWIFSVQETTITSWKQNKMRLLPLLEAVSYCGRLHHSEIHIGQGSSKNVPSCVSSGMLSALNEMHHLLSWFPSQIVPGEPK
jgi:hypothetical protein